MPAVRAARGETLSTSRSTGTRPSGLRTVLVSGSTIALGSGRRVTVVTFEDVTTSRVRAGARSCWPTSCG